VCVCMRAIKHKRIFLHSADLYGYILQLIKYLHSKLKIKLVIIFAVRALLHSWRFCHHLLFIVIFVVLDGVSRSGRTGESGP
jgi:hypothetical protein